MSSYSRALPLISLALTGYELAAAQQALFDIRAWCMVHASGWRSVGECDVALFGIKQLLHGINPHGRHLKLIPLLREAWR